MIVYDVDMHSLVWDAYDVVADVPDAIHGRCSCVADIQHFFDLEASTFISAVNQCSTFNLAWAASLSVTSRPPRAKNFSNGFPSLRIFVDNSPWNLRTILDLNAE